jgi:hypothetical protein
MAVHGAESSILRKLDQKYLESFEMWCLGRMGMISLTDPVRNEVLHMERHILYTMRNII